MKSNYLLTASIISYLISLGIPVHFEFDKYISVIGLVYLSLGWVTFPHLDFFCWLGNFTLIFSWIFCKFKIGIILSFITPILMIIYAINFLFELDILDAQQYYYPLFGYWIWLLSSILAIVYHYRLYKSKGQTL